MELEQYNCEEKDKWEKFRSREKELESELSSIKSTYEDELLELRKNAQDTLQEQVGLAKADALNSLQQQIQVNLVGRTPILKFLSSSKRKNFLSCAQYF